MTEGSVFGIVSFGIDHFRPKKLFPELTFVYDNLYYCCNDCNRYKGPVWPSAESAAEGYFFPDPCECDPQLDHLTELEDCRWEGRSNAGVFALEVMRLNRESCLRFRKRRQTVQRRILKYQAALDSIESVEVRDLLTHALTELESECAEIYGPSLGGQHVANGSDVPAGAVFSQHD